MKQITLSVLFALFAVSAEAEVALGTWLTQPDKKAQVAHVAVAKCGAALCGTIVRAYDKAGKQITTPNVGKRIFWDVKPTGKGDYAGRAWVPAFNREYPASMSVSGNRMVVKGCFGPACMSQKWTRVN